MVKVSNYMIIVLNKNVKVIKNEKENVIKKRERMDQTHTSALVRNIHTYIQCSVFYICI